jgi:antitoxin component YwqK of YwqJK toxin-antitoxin module
MNELPDEMIVEIIKSDIDVFATMLFLGRRWYAICRRDDRLMDAYAASRVTIIASENHIYGTLQRTDAKIFNRDHFVGRVMVPLEYDWKHGKEITCCSTLADDKRLYEAEWRYGKPHNKEIYYSWGLGTCRVVSERHWRDGVQHGPETSYYTNGQICTQTMWSNGVKSGVETSYDTFGNIIHTATFINGRVATFEWPDGVAQVVEN